MSFQGQRIVVIGGTSGIGRAVAHRVAQDGATVVLASSNADKVAAAAKELPGATGLPLNVRDETAIASFFERVGRYDHLIYTAGDWPLPRAASIAEIDIAAASDIFQVRCICALACVKHGVKSLNPTGSIILTDGALGGRARKGASPLLAAMAAGNQHMVRALALELAPLRVNGVAPGGIANETDDPQKIAIQAAINERLKGRQPIDRLGAPAEIVEAYLYLLRGTYTTGQIMYVDGGGML